MLRTLALLALVVALGLCCTVDQEQLSTTPKPDEISFEVIDGLGNGFEGLDKVRVKSTAGELSKVVIYLSTNGGTPPFDQHTLTSSGNGLFELDVLCAAYQTKWYVGAEGLGVTTSFGSITIPFSVEKYLSKTNADLKIADQMRVLLSGGKFATYLPNLAGGNFLYTDPLDTSIVVPFDHFIDQFTIDQQHAKYGIEYNTALSSNTSLAILNAETDRYAQLKVSNNQDMGYVIIASTDTLGLAAILINPNFFPPTPATFLEVIHD
jgi:hypothetical protein